MTASSTPQKRKLKIEIYSEQDSNEEYTNEPITTEIFTELEPNEIVPESLTITKENQQQAMNESLQMYKTNEKIATQSKKQTNLSETDNSIAVSLAAAVDKPEIDSFGTNIDKLTEVIGKCIGLAEKCIVENSTPDSSTVFGKFIASLVLELPPEKRMQARLNILKFTGDLINKEMKK